LAAAVNFCWDQACFALGRWRGAWLIHRSSHLAAGIERMRPHLARHRRWVIFSVRFMYGFRTAGPVALGIAGTTWREFVLFNALGAMTWATLFSTLGFVFGRAISTLVGELAHYEAEAVMAIIFGGLVAFLLHHLRARRGKGRT
jgi:membrane protein DedA with SNARE-associated domain